MRSLVLCFDRSPPDGQGGGRRARIRSGGAGHGQSVAASLCLSTPLPGRTSTCRRGAGARPPERSCRRWQLLRFATGFTRYVAPRHAPRASPPASKPESPPREEALYTIAALRGQPPNPCATVPLSVLGMVRISMFPVRQRSGPPASTVQRDFISRSRSRRQSRSRSEARLSARRLPLAVAMASFARLRLQCRSSGTTV